MRETHFYNVAIQAHAVFAEEDHVEQDGAVMNQRPVDRTGKDDCSEDSEPDGQKTEYDATLRLVNRWGRYVGLRQGRASGVSFRKV